MILDTSILATLTIWAHIYMFTTNGIVVFSVPCAKLHVFSVPPSNPFAHNNGMSR